MNPANLFQQELERLRENDLLRTLTTIGSGCAPRVMVSGRSLVSLCSNDYLGLASHPALREAAVSAMVKFGFGSGASRLVSGNTALHEELEARIASFKGAEAALLFNSGHAANTGIIPALVGPEDAVFSDRLNHASIIDGCRLSGARVAVYRHCDLGHLEELLGTHASNRRKLIVTDGVFSMDGDIAPLPGIVALAERYECLVMVDDAHAVGVLGRSGRGTAEHFDLKRGVHIQMGTLGKALGSFGAYAACGREAATVLMNRSRSFLFSTALPPAVCAASIAALDILDHEPERLARLRENVLRLRQGLASVGLEVSGTSGTPIIPVIIGSAGKALRAARRLFELGILAPAIRPPSVPQGTARIRTTVSAAHGEREIREAIDAFAELKKEGSIGHAG